ncbi:hypothetical protein [Nitrincola alkalilacustris]|uniref:hypothetical protein n=1 Tax=Nitrincola alkalilacustris TaxID=1571224 RepID=UPI00124EAA8E|nr:hypothetical protein [Nitrincola alkalilacustris]
MYRMKQTFGALLLSLALIPSAQAVEYWTGGIGSESRQEAPAHNTKVEFFARDGAFLADIDFTLSRESGEVLVQGVADGPWLIVDLPDGSYRLTGVLQSTQEVQTITFRVSGQSRQTLGLRFNP